MNDAADMIARDPRQRARVAPADAGLARIRSLRFKAPGYDPAVWRHMGALGWIGLHIPEAHGGSGLGLLEAGRCWRSCGGRARAGAAGAGCADSLGAGRRRRYRTAAARAWPASVSRRWRGRKRRQLDAPGTSGERCFSRWDRKAGRCWCRSRRVAAWPCSKRNRVLRGRASAGRAVRGPAGWRPGRDVVARPCQRPAHRPDRSRRAGPGARRCGAGDGVLPAGPGGAGVRDDARLPPHPGAVRPQLGSFQALQHRAADLKIGLVLTRASVERPLPRRSMPAPRGRCARRRCRVPRPARRTPRWPSRGRRCSCTGRSGTPTNTTSDCPCGRRWWWRTSSVRRACTGDALPRRHAAMR